MLTIAMPKGRIFEEAVELLRRADYALPPEFTESRKLVIDVPEENMRFILAKPMDVVTYVEHGVADLGIAGKDVLMEEERDVYELLDLHISRCHLAVAGMPGAKMNEIAPRVATKYPNIASTYFREQGEQVEIIRLNGSIELAPLIGLADRIVDIVSTGRTLRENGLVELERIAEVTSRLIVNPASYRLNGGDIERLVDRLAAVIPQP
ncbi:ATP phosphoribosyltransferase [Geobacillus thermoleovorans]|uniref:ATP phosphoribosyltransferase n=1 Tax=Geobacillus kaustophilus (strain HTA426) TaxID=235909 RepID=HIS1_GEOKA|nr:MULTISPECIES: ATP phosphoribosyltransferase [Geobacillus]Q5KVC5.1 RecName: Full=ATP phosphoribosyltransferase; Short=ATP-PRT; Short=ATP-PRTase [Geobacillus kaustophilus HTA426]AMV12221.1 ATP phosphoribosyltransferase [Geobacillus thermoleovorans]AOL35744.1 ATP phosphoribosyltransferase [Geobacillus thermoleovorans]TLS33037.1 ATP phosphoribosyltransferase [Geobacillus thermoleovorans]TRY39149.1 ATP phosphoribosyltransferase [Geobacillus sp. LEMMJ02]WMJ19690.1 ATP phosphoribosyltransferase [